MEEEIFDFDTIIKDYDKYNVIKKNLKNKLLENYACRHNLATVKLNNEELHREWGRIYLDLYLIEPFVVEHLVLTKKDLFNKDVLDQQSLENYFNRILNSHKEGLNNTNYDSIRRIIYNIENEMADNSGEFNLRYGPSISFNDFVRLSVESEEARDIFYPKLEYGMQFNEIEDKFALAGNNIFDFFGKHEETDLYPFIASGTGINKKQLTQCISFIGLKPEIDGKVIPYVNNDNYLIGLHSLDTYYISCKGCRKALITNRKYTSKSGYLTRKLSLAMIDHYHDNDNKDCGTSHYLIYNVQCKEKLHQIIGRCYYDIDDNNEKISDELKTVTAKDKFLIGRKIGLRSPVTCCGEDGHVCATCYGPELSEINKNTNTGLVGVFTLTKDLTQRLLSAKHLLSTNTNKINWPEEFSDIFILNMNAIYFNAGIDSTISFAKPSLEDYDEDEEMFYTNTIFVANGRRKQTTCKSPVKLFINPKLLTNEQMSNNDDTISLSSIKVGEGDFLFKFETKNNELTKSLQQILDLIESSEHLGITDYNEFVNKFDDLLIENNMSYINSIHIEMIASVLIRDAKTNKRLNFGAKELNEYKISRVSKAVINSPLSVSLSFERLNDQLTNLDTYEKNGKSLMDYLFR